MANMSYCRFQNTEPDLRDCCVELENASLEVEDDDGVTREYKAAKRMAELAERYLAAFKEFDNNYGPRGRS